MDIKQAFDLWVEITGVNPDEKTIRLRDMDVHRANGLLKQSLVYDETYVTTVMLMKMYLEDFMVQRELSLKQIVDNYEEFQGWLNKIARLKNILVSEEMNETLSDFKSLIGKGLDHYGIDQAVYSSMVENEHNLTELRYSALNAINKLEVVQFTHGTPSEKKARIHKNLYQFKDINTLLTWMMNVESGVILALIYGEEGADPYFVFAVRNGGTLSVLTDRDSLAHPLQGMMSRTRSSGRKFYERMFSYHFPYSVLDVNVGDNNRAYLDTSTTALGNLEDGSIVNEIKNLQHDEVVWLVMMFSLIEDKFFKENFQVKELSFTPKMIETSNFLLDEAKANEVAVINYPSLNLPKITNESMKTENLKGVFSVESTGQYDWMIERYEVPEEAYQVTNGQVDTVLIGQDDSVSMFATDKRTLKKMNMSSFETAEKLEKDRLFLARYNQALLISEQAKKEFEQKKEEVQKWVKEAINKNLPSLLKAIAKNEFILQKDPQFARIKEGSWEKCKTNGNILGVREIDKDNSYYNIFCEFAGRGSDYWRSKYNCVVSHTTATLVGHFYPTNASQLAELCGCEQDELPELIRHWKNARYSSGNSILDNIDPLDWAIRDPWEKMRMDVRIYVSKREYNKLCKEYETGNESFWLKKEE